MKFMKAVFAIALLAPSISMADATNDPYQYAHTKTYQFGVDTSDWGEAVVDNCTSSEAPDVLTIECIGQNKILGPGGGVELTAPYSCVFTFQKSTNGSYEIAESNINCY